MDTITIIEGDDLKHLMDVLTQDPQAIYAVRIHQTDDGQAKIKVNSYTWSPPLGTLDA